MTIHSCSAGRRPRPSSATMARCVLVLLAMLASVLCFATASSAEPSASGLRAAPGRDDDGRIIARWGGPTVHVDWTGAPYKTVQASFVGDRVATPGDDVHRTLHIGNAGPSKAVMAVSLDLSQVVPAAARNPELAEHIEIYWNAAGVEGHAPFSALLRRNQGRPVIAQVQVPRGSTVPVTAGFRMARETTAARSQGRASAELHFDVLVRMSGDTSETGILPETGLSAGVLAAALAGAMLLLLGLILLLRRGRRCDWCRELIGADGGLVLVGQGRSRERYCLRCGPRSSSPRRTA